MIDAVCDWVEAHVPAPVRRTARVMGYVLVALLVVALFIDIAYAVGGGYARHRP